MDHAAYALAMICLTLDRRKGRCHNRTVEIPARTALLPASELYGEEFNWRVSVRDRVGSRLLSPRWAT